eukprot:scaffold952_cov409-Prasinococcus_capsulatus_cf.AAC.72
MASIAPPTRWQFAAASPAPCDAYEGGPFRGGADEGQKAPLEAHREPKAGGIGPLCTYSRAPSIGVHGTLRFWLDSRPRSVTGRGVARTAIFWREGESDSLYNTGGMPSYNIATVLTLLARRPPVWPRDGDRTVKQNLALSANPLPSPGTSWLYE